MSLIIVPTSFVVYSVVDTETGELKFAKECKSKGEAVKWIYKSGEKDTTYTIREHLKRKK